MTVVRFSKFLEGPAGNGGALAVAATAAVAYLVLSPSVPGDKDASELALVLATGGVAHPTGYPLYTILGHLFVSGLRALGVGWAYAANAWSAVGGAVAIFFLYRLALALLPTRTWLALLPILLFGLNPIWTVETTLAEVYSWHLAWVGGAALAFLRAMRAPAASGRGAAVWGLLCGLGAANHLSALVIAAPLTLVLAWRHRPSLRQAAAAVATGVVPLLAYGYIAWHAFHPAVVQWPLLAPSWIGVWNHITGAQYHYMVGRYAPSPVQQGLLAHYVYPFLWPGLALLALGVLRATTREDRLARGALFAAAALQTISAFRYGAYDPASYFLPALALGLVAVAPAAADLLRARRDAARVLLAAAVVGTVVLGVTWTRTGLARNRTYESLDLLLRRMWASITYERAIVIWADDMTARLRCYQILEHDKPDISVINPGGLFDPTARGRFAANFGFDPLVGLSLPTREAAAGPNGAAVLGRAVLDVQQNINTRTELPVIVFDPQGPSVRLLKKPGTE